MAFSYTGIPNQTITAGSWSNTNMVHGSLFRVSNDISITGIDYLRTGGSLYPTTNFYVAIVRASDMSVLGYSLGRTGVVSLNTPVSIKKDTDYYMMHWHGTAGNSNGHWSATLSGQSRDMPDGTKITYGTSYYVAPAAYGFELKEPPAKMPTTYTASYGCGLGFVYERAGFLSVEHDFPYTGGVQTFIAPYTGSYDLEVWGAQGGDAGYNGAINTKGGNGGYARGFVTLTKGEVLRIYVGGKGTSGNNLTTGNVLPGGYNGGGSGTNGNGSSARGAGGGGGTDIRRVGSALSQRIIVAGGGAGAVYYPGYGTNNPGAGGGPVGVGGSTSTFGFDGHQGKGGSQTGGGAGGSNGGQAGGGSLGLGGNSILNYGYGEAGGGGGYYGGGGSGTGMAAGGGSGYIGGVDSGAMDTGVRTGHGAARIRLDIVSNIVNNVTVDKARVLSGDQIAISWSVSDIGNEYLEEVNFKFRVEINTGSGFVVMADEVSKNTRSIIHTIPKGIPRYTYAIVRVKSYYVESTEDYDDWVDAPSFVIDRHSSVVKDGEKFYTYSSSKWVEITGVQNKNWFYQYGMGDLNHIPEAKWEELSDTVSIVSFTNSAVTPIIDVTVPSYKPIYLLDEAFGILSVKANSSLDGNIYLNRVANPKGQLIVQTEDIIFNAPTIPRAIKKATFKSDTVGTSTNNRRVVISVDKGETFYTWNGSEWQDIGEIINDDASKDSVRTIGMTIEDFNARTQEDWYNLFGRTPRHVRFAYYLEMDLFSNQLTVDDVEFLMDVTGSWRKARQKDYEYSYPVDGVMQIELFSSGDFKINY